jgi:hypothetical protein
VLQILDFLEQPQVAGQLEAARGERHVDAGVIDALMALEPRVKALRPRRQPMPANAGDESHGG